VSDSFKTGGRGAHTVDGMKPSFYMIGLVVADLGASLAFYRRLGLDIPADAEKEPHVEYVIPDGPRLAWDTVETVRSFDPAWTAPQGGHRMALAFQCESPDAVDRLFNELVAAGHREHKAPWDAFWGQRYAMIYDPDGNSVELFAPLPTTA
jgi:catechol 2,3-dioxygenase-like lactoylglutathione lyase family enzyme